MPLLNTEDGIQKARQALMDNLKSHGCQTRPSGDQNDAGEETTIFTRGDLCVELSSKGGLFVRPLNNDGGQLGDYLGAGFGGQHGWQMAQENGGFILCHTLSARGVPAQRVIEVVDDEFGQITLDDRVFFKICSTKDDNAFQKITWFGLLCCQAWQRTKHVNRPPPAGRGCDTGASEGGARSSYTWEAEHHPLTQKIAEYLIQIGWTAAPKLKGWRPDILFEKCDSPHSGKILIEVKPICDAHNVITAIGQLLCYSLPLVDSPVILVLATNGQVENHLAKALEHYAIKALNLAKDDWKANLEALCPSADALSVKP